MTVFFIAVFGLYFLLLLVLWLGWSGAPQSENAVSSKTNSISVVVAMRNESQNVGKLLESLSLQTYDRHVSEVIIVDDHSTDESQQEARKWSGKVPLSVLSLNEKHGKKAALALGISSAKGEIIATTDADCIVPANWLQKINGGFQQQETNMLVGRVALQNEENFFYKLQSLEYASVIGTGIALAALGKPTMCSGANLSFRKKTFDAVNGYADNEHIASGDDEFLMRKIVSRSPHSVGVLGDSVVVTNPQASLNDFIYQRLRWASKWKFNSFGYAKILAVFIFLVQVSWLTLVVRLASHWSGVVLLVSMLKLLGDFVFLFSVCRTLKMKFNMLAFVALQFLYPIYVLWVGSFSWKKNHQWKGRRI